jgi:hypothetical protein
VAVAQVPQFLTQEGELVLQALGGAKGGDGERRQHEDEENPAREQDQSPQRLEEVQR